MYFSDLVIIIRMYNYMQIRLSISAGRITAARRLLTSDAQQISATTALRPKAWQADTDAMKIAR